MSETPNDAQKTPVIVFDRVEKQYLNFAALRGVSETVGAGEVIILCGPSGSGKSTLIRTVNRLEEVQSGRILVNGVDVTDRTVDINRLRLTIGFVFQQYNLFPHLSVIDNVSLALFRLLGMGREEARSKARELLAKVGLEAKAERRPNGLSGGEQQRVAIVRALATQPSVMLLDEPTSALDPVMAGEVRAMIRSLVHRDITVMCVTHDMRFAREIADRIWFLEQGQVVAAASPEEFFASENPRLKTFLSKILH